MTHVFISSLADSNATLANVGGKGASLARLANAGLPVPDGFHVTTEAYRQFVTANDLQPRILTALQVVDVSQPTTLEAASRAIYDLFTNAPMPHDIAGAIARAYLTLPGAGPAVAVRSSATAEDLPDLSFAGQQETFLNIQGAVAVQDAVKRCWASLWTPRAIGYRTQHQIAHDAVALAVVVQKLVYADAAGIMFTANPVNGRRDQIVINAAWGLGEAIVGGLVTPDTLVVDKASGRVLERDTADKTVMTVRVDEGTEERPAPENLRRAPVLGDEQAAELARLGALIENLYKMPMDIEWTLTENRFAIVQARPITALPEPTAPEPTEWKLPDSQGQYVRGSIVEYMPDPLSPLFCTLGGAIVDMNTRRLFAQILGRDPGGMFTTINDYAYLKVPIKFTPLAILQMLGGMLNAAPRMMRTGEQRWREDGRPRYVNTIERWQAKRLSDLAAAEILTGVREILDAAIYLYTILQSGPVAVAVSSETTFTRIYDKMIKRKDDPPAAIFVLGYDSAPIFAEKSLYDLAEWCRPRAPFASHVINTPTPQLIAQLQSDETPAGVDSNDWHEWQNRFRAHLQKHGHTIYDLDFAKATPADDPTPLLDIVKMFLHGQGTSPYARQSQMATRREQATQAMLGKLKWLRLMLFRKFVTSAQKWAPLREDSISDLGLGYPLIRRMLRELGSRFVQAGAIGQSDDIFWLFESEVERTVAALDRRQPVESYAERIPKRKAILQAEMRVTPPPGLPAGKKFMGLDIEKMGPARVSGQTGDTIQGAGTSPGKVTAPARVLRGPEEFDQMKPGEILIAVATTPAWTPLFAMASAIVTDIGGPLSHGSIVAREYGIPAVLGTGVATKRIHSGQLITVDGSAGRVHLNVSGTPGGGPDSKSPEPQVPTPIEWTRSMPEPKGQYMRVSIVDLMPGPVSPLFATLGLGALNTKIHQMLTEMLQTRCELPRESFLTINAYAYQSAGFNARQWWWMITRMIPKMLHVVRTGLVRWRDIALPRYTETAQRWQARALADLSTPELWVGIRQVMDAAMYNLASQMAWMGGCAGSEGLFTRVYEKLIKREGDPAAPTFLMGYDTAPIRAEKSLYDLAMWIRARAQLAAHVSNTLCDQLAAEIARDEIPTNVNADDWREMQNRFRAHLQQFGYTIYDLDFAKPLPLDDPAPMLETIRMYLRGEGHNPHERQQAAEAKRKQANENALRRVKGVKRWAFTKSLNWAQSLAEMREDGIAAIGIGYPILRKMLLELGARLVRAGALEQPGDIFWLRQNEVEELVTRLERGDSIDSMVSHVQQRQAIARAAKLVTPPPMLPPKKRYMGINVESFAAADESSHTTDTLKGVGASAGQVTATARVLRGSEDFDQMRPGEVLVAGITTPAWTPLFAMASAVVTDIGGPLSHGSIVAREYGIPAVLGTGVATKRIHSGQVITVDGSAGTVTLSRN